jgi:membrane protein required for colicin V production
MNWLDYVIIGIVGLSGLLALMRGFLKEILALVGWVGAALATFFGLPYLSPHARELIKSETIADVGSGVLIFIVFLVVWAFATGLVTKRIGDGTLGFVDRVLGFFFGVLRGALLVVLAYLLAQIAFKENNMPAWIQEAKTRPIMEEGARIIQRITPEDWLERGKKALEDLQGKKTDGKVEPPPGQPNRTTP